MNDRASRPY